MTIKEQLDKLNAEYNAYYKANRKHLAYKGVKQAIQVMRDQIAMLEFQLNKEGQR